MCIYMYENFLSFLKQFTLRVFLRILFNVKNMKDEKYKKTYIYFDILLNISGFRYPAHIIFYTINYLKELCLTYESLYL